MQIMQFRNNVPHSLPIRHFLLKTVSQSEIDHIVMAELAQTGIFGAVEKHITGGNLPVVTDFVFREYLGG